jgi:hypothetical protein
MTPKTIVDRTWFRATLTPMAQGIFTDAFYPDPKRGSGAQFVFFTQEDVTPSQQKVIVASKLAESGLRMMTLELAQKCLIPSTKATKEEMRQLNILSINLKM